MDMVPWRRRLAQGLLLAGVAASLASAAAIAAPSAVVSLSLNPSSGPPGTSVTVSGAGWTPANVNPPYVIFWQVKGGTVLGSFAPGAGGSWSTKVTIPAGASPGVHNIVACEGYKIEFEVCTSAAFTVVSPITPTPSATRTPTRTPTPVFTPTLTPTPTPTATATEPPSVCGDLGLGPEAEVLDFDGGTPASSTIDLEGSAVIEAPAAVRPHSGARAARSRIAMEFGSALLPITMVFDPVGATAIGMFVGLDTADWVDSEITATLSAFGYVGDSAVLTPLGTGAVSFAPVPTDIKHCLVFRAGEGEVIARVEVEYTDAGGTSLADARWIDDVTVVWAEQPLPEDETPPVVEITMPGEGALFPGGSVDVRARVVEDRRLQDVWYQVNDGLRQVVGFAPVAGDPTLYLTGFGVAPRLLTPYAENSITVWAQDRAGLRGSDTVTIFYAPPTPTPSLDIRLVTFEVTQAVQCMRNPDCGDDNSIPIFTGKPTLIRLYVASNQPASNISGRLCREGACIDSLNRVNVQPSDDPVADFRDDLAETLNFMLPQGWVSLGRQRFSAEVNPGMADAPECCGDNNRWPMAFYTVRESKRLDIKMIRIRAGGVTASDAGRWEAVGYLRYVYPTGNIRIWTRDGDRSMSANYDYTDRSGSGCGDGWGELLDDLWWHNFWNDDPVDWYRYYGMIDERVAHGFHGCGYTPGDEAGGVVSTGASHYVDLGGEILAQEVGHNHGREHAPGCGAGSPDRRYPAGTDSAGSAGVGVTGEWGVDLRTMTLRPPDSNYDFMGYCGSSGSVWVSPYTYRAMSDALRRVAQNVEPGSGRALARAADWQAAPEILAGNVWVTPTEARLTRPFYRTLLPADQALPQADKGAYAVDLLDASGVSLRRGFFDFTALSNDDDQTEGPLHIVLPWAPGTASIAVSLEGKVLLEVPVSPSAPSVTVVRPNGGESLGPREALRVEWTGSDPDGDMLTYNVQFSADGGTTWSALALFVEETELEVDLSELAGTERGRIRVIASDGVNTASDASDADFSIGRKGPQAMILSPMDGQVYNVGEEVVLEGGAADYEDGLVDDSAYSWSSDRDGSLGEGPRQWALPISPGRHRITLSVTDADGMTSSDTVTILIGSEGPRRPALGAVLGLVGLAVLGAVGALLLFLAARGGLRRAR